MTVAPAVVVCGMLTFPGTVTTGAMRSMLTGGDVKVAVFPALSDATTCPVRPAPDSVTTSGTRWRRGRNPGTGVRCRERERHVGTVPTRAIGGRHGCAEDERRRRRVLNDYVGRRRGRRESARSIAFEVSTKGARIRAGRQIDFNGQRRNALSSRDDTLRQLDSVQRESAPVRSLRALTPTSASQRTLNCALSRPSPVPASGQ